MLEDKVEIIKARNGFIMSCTEEIDQDENLKTYEVYQEEFIFGDDPNGDENLKRVDEEKVAFTKLVYGLANRFGIEYNKYGDQNLNITWDKKGHKID